MSLSKQQVQGIKIKNTNMNQLEAEVEVLKVIDNSSSQLDPYKGLLLPSEGVGVENVYYLDIDSEEAQISSYVYVTDDPESDLMELKKNVELMVDKRKNLLTGSSQRDDLVWALALQSRINDLGKAIEFKIHLLNLRNPALEKDNPEITATLI